MTFVLEHPDRGPDFLAIPQAIQDDVCAAGGLDPYRSTPFSDIEARAMCVRLRGLLVAVQADTLLTTARRLGVTEPFPVWFRDRRHDFSRSQRADDLLAVITWIESGRGSARIRMVGE